MVQVIGSDPVFKVDPGLVGRCAWEIDETQRDVEVLAWVGRFRFVTAQAIGRRFGLSWQRANARVRRLERLGLFGCERAHVSQARAVFLTSRGHELLGWPRRRPPRAQMQREHEHAIVKLVTDLETQSLDGVVVLTERECRQREAAGVLQRYSVEVYGTDARDRRRWPDVVIERAGGREAIEIEFAPKGTRRLRQIVAAFESSRYEQVTFMVKDAALGRRIQRASTGPSALQNHLGLGGCAVAVVPWTGLPAEQRTMLLSKLGRPLYGEPAS